MEKIIDKANVLNETEEANNEKNVLIWDFNDNLCDYMAIV